jgi:hypothetical protein
MTGTLIPIITRNQKLIVYLIASIKGVNCNHNNFCQLFNDEDSIGKVIPLRLFKLHPLILKYKN